MAFVMIATGATSRSRVRTLAVRPLVGAGLSAALALLVAGAGLGYWIAASQPERTPPAAVAAAPARPPASPPFTLEQLGAISARLFRLESEAAQLSRRFAAPRTGAAPADARADGSPRKPVAVEPHGASGGPLLAPRAELPADLGALDAQLARIERQITALAGAAAQRTVALMRLPTRLPIAGAEITSLFGNRDDPFVHRHAFHAGLDFAALRGTPIRAAAGGTVAFAGFKPDYGWVVEIDHGNGLTTRYAHASALLVRTGAVVGPGEPIARVGSTGRSTGPHLHFEVLEAGVHVDPKRYLAGL